MTQKQYEELKDAIKVLFDLLTYEEQEMIIDVIKKHRANQDG